MLTLVFMLANTPDTSRYAGAMGKARWAIDQIIVPIEDDGTPEVDVYLSTFIVQLISLVVILVG
jgi:hypothetical protein